MLRLLRELDGILRGQATRLPELRAGTIRIDLAGIGLLSALLGAVYGLCMGSFALINRADAEPMQAVASMVKVPALFALTLLVTFPSLYVFNALVGSRLALGAVFRLLIASLAVTLAVLASFGPIAAFFSFTTENYPFMLLLHVVIFAVSGVLGLAFLLQTLHRLTVATLTPAAMLIPTPAPADPAVQPAAAALDRLEGHVLGGHVKAVFRIWIIVFGLVGAQMAWVLRPFLGSPELPFAWFRARESNFFEAVWRAIVNVFSLGLYS